MKQILTVARRELRAYFLSPVALIFLSIFLLTVLFVFFTWETFFRRNVADVRPLFEWLPVILIPLVSALVLRGWSDEQRMGTLEVLMTLPVKVRNLVLGKFLAGLGLVAVALLLTFGLPITISFLGDLDWGPVWGGYIAALLVASAYLAIGLFISAATPQPIVAFLLTGLACGGFYLIGSEHVTGFAGNRWGEILRAIGTGSRFASIERGVVDLRDLVYYGSLTVAFLYLNVAVLESKKWSEGASTSGRRLATRLGGALVVANLILLNVWVADVRGVRIDMTERDEYSVSPVTEQLLDGLDAPLLIRGYFSEKTHPLLAPLVPRIRDLIEEYGAVGGAKVRADFIDPRQDPAAEKEANEAYGIRSVPFQFADRHESSVVNSYFHLLIKYGDKYEKLSFDDLIEVNVSGGMNKIEVKLRNLEYDLTRTIKKVVYGFQPLEEVFARAPEKISLTAYVTPKTLPDELRKIAELVEKVAQELKQRSGGKLEFQVVDPSGEDKAELRQKLHRQHGFRPMAASLLSGESFYNHLLFSMGDRHERLLPAPETAEAELKEEMEAALKRMVPGFLKTVGLHVSEVAQPPPNPMMRQRPPRGPSYELLKQKLSETYEVQEVDLKGGRVPGDVDVLLLAGPTDLDEKQRYAVDQFLMRGGAVVLASGRYTMDISNMQQGLALKKLDPKLGEMLGQWGISVKESLVLDPQSDSFPVPVERDVMGMRVREIQLLDYPFWIDVRGSGMPEGNAVVAGLPSVTLQWVSPVEVQERQGIEAQILLRSSQQAWTQDSADIQPDFDEHPGTGFGPGKGAERREYPLAVAATGLFDSAFKGKPSPLLQGEGAEQGGAAGKAAAASGRTIEQSPKSARLVVVGSGDFLRDDVLGLARQTGSDKFINNLRFAQNVVDWSVADADLLAIRARGTYARTLAPLEDAARTRWEIINYVIVVLGLAAVVIGVYVRRRGLRPISVSRSGSAPKPAEG